MDPKKISTKNKPPEISHRTLEENEDFKNKLFQLKNQVDEMSGIMLKLVDLSCSIESLNYETKYEIKKISWIKIEKRWKRR
jgi:hypothetical protein